MFTAIVVGWKYNFNGSRVNNNAEEDFFLLKLLSLDEQRGILYPRKSATAAEKKLK